MCRQRRMCKMGQKCEGSFTVGHPEASVIISPTQNNLGQYYTPCHKTPNCRWYPNDLSEKSKFWYQRGGKKKSRLGRLITRVAFDH